MQIIIQLSNLKTHLSDLNIENISEFLYIASSEYLLNNRTITF